MRRASAGEIGRSLRRRAAGARAAVPDPRRRGRGRRDRDRGLDHRHRLRDRRWPAHLPRSSTGGALWPMLVDTASLSGAILLIIGTATAMAWALTQSGFSRQLAARWRRCRAARRLPGGLDRRLRGARQRARGHSGDRAVRAAAVSDRARSVGIHEVHYAMVVILAMGIGLFAPPFGVGYYAACAIGRVDPAEGIGRSGPISSRCWSGSSWSRRCRGFRWGFCRCTHPGPRVARSRNP